MRNSPNILHRDSIINPNELSFSTTMEPCSPIQIQHKNAKTAMAGHFKIRKGSLERDGKESALTDLQMLMRKPIMGGGKPADMIALKPMIRRKSTVRDCHFSHPKHSKKDWKLPGFNKWRLSAGQAKKIYIEHRAGANVSLTKQ